MNETLGEAARVSGTNASQSLGATKNKSNSIYTNNFLHINHIIVSSDIIIQDFLLYSLQFLSSKISYDLSLTRLRDKEQNC